MIAKAPVAAGPERTRLRVEIPEHVLRMARFGVRHADDEPGWWRRVERELESFVYRHLPAAASDVRLALDDESDESDEPDRYEVLVEYAL